MCAQYVTNCYSKSKGKRLEKKLTRQVQGVFEVNVAVTEACLKSFKNGNGGSEC